MTTSFKRGGWALCLAALAIPAAASGEPARVIVAGDASPRVAVPQLAYASSGRMRIGLTLVAAERADAPLPRARQPWPPGLTQRRALPQRRSGLTGLSRVPHAVPRASGALPRGRRHTLHRASQLGLARWGGLGRARAAAPCSYASVRNSPTACLRRQACPPPARLSFRPASTRLAWSPSASSQRPCPRRPTTIRRHRPGCASCRHPS